MGNESFIKLLNKLNSLPKIKLELSSEVNNKREKLDEITSYIQKKLIKLAEFENNNLNSLMIESLDIYYCFQCKFFSDFDKCIICQQSLRKDFGANYFNFFNYSNQDNILLLKYYLEIFSNLFQLENIMKEYNNITLRDSQETVKAFLYEIQNENSNNIKISQNINDIAIKYKEYKNGFNKQISIQNDFVLYLFNQLVQSNCFSNY